jgi:hypothetical protein
MATAALGVAECALAVWVLSSRARRAAAGVQTALIASMNAGGWWFARGHLHNPRRLLLRNSLLVAAIWMVATGGNER